MKKTVLSLMAFSALTVAGEFEYGKGTFTMNGGFLGLTNDIDADVDTYSMVGRHSNVAGSEFFYGYDLMWMDSKTLKQNQQEYNNNVNNGNNMLGLNNNLYAKIPAMDYSIQGLDANLRLGYDVIHKDADNFLGLGLMVGLSLPWIDSKKSDSDNDNNAIADMYKESETTVMTYKVGPTITFQKTLISDKLSLYGVGSYAYQTGSIENDKVNSDLSVDGTFQEYNIGLYFTPFTETFKWGFLTLSPRIYGTIGYKYSKWDVDKVSINMSGNKMDSDILDPLATDFSMESSVAYVGMGYSF